MTELVDQVGLQRWKIGGGDLGKAKTKDSLFAGTSNKVVDSRHLGKYLI
jgi:hypothetical protein